MAHIRLLRDCLVGDRVHRKGETVQVGEKLAQAHVKAGTGVAVTPPAAPAVERAVAKPQR